MKINNKWDIFRFTKKEKQNIDKNKEQIDLLVHDLNEFYLSPREIRHLKKETAPLEYQKWFIKT